MPASPHFLRGQHDPGGKVAAVRLICRDGLQATQLIAEADQLVRSPVVSAGKGPTVTDGDDLGVTEGQDRQGESLGHPLQVGIERPGAADFGQLIEGDGLFDPAISRPKPTGGDEVGPDAQLLSDIFGEGANVGARRAGDVDFKI